MAVDAERHFKENPTKLWVPPSRGDTSRANDGVEYCDPLDAFPDIAPPHRPVGYLIMVQLRMPALTTAGVVDLKPEEIQTERDNTQVAKVVALGEMAFKSRETGKEWPEGRWFNVGDFVRIPKYQGDRVAVRYRRKVTRLRPTPEDPDHRIETFEDADCIFVGIKELQVLGVYSGVEQALRAKAFYE